MRRITVLIASALINASTIPGLAAESTLNKDVSTAPAVSATAHGKPAEVADNEKTCRAYATSFYESVMLRQAAASRVDGARVLTALDSVINAFNDLLATKCGG
jgi:phage gp37-like protein